MAFSGAWLTQSQVDPQVPLVPGLDPQHLSPDANPQFMGMSPDWRNTAPAPDLPEAIMSPLPEPMPTGTGPVERIDYNDTLAGVGWGHGLGTLEAQDQGGAARLVDDGSYAARRYQVAPDPGGQHHAAILYADAAVADSPSSTLLLRSGVGMPNDPDARRAGRLNRWFDGKIDMHRWEVSFRPLRPRYARTPKAQVNRDPHQREPHTQSVIGYNPGSLDTFVQQIVRRAPGSWAQPFDHDGSNSAIVGATNNYGLPQWGM